MVCGRCEMAVEIGKNGAFYSFYSIREVEIATDLDEVKSKCYQNDLLGFELLDDKENKTVERIKNLIIDLVYYKRNN
jgi:hypothetical protein